MSKETQPDDLTYVIIEEKKTPMWTALVVLVVIGIIIWAVISWVESYTIFPLFIVISGHKISRLNQGGYTHGY